MLWVSHLDSRRRECWQLFRLRLILTTGITIGGSTTILLSITIMFGYTTQRHDVLGTTPTRHRLTIDNRIDQPRRTRPLSGLNSCVGGLPA
jgi:hypothetical protein